MIIWNVFIQEHFCAEKRPWTQGEIGISAEFQGSMGKKMAWFWVQFSSFRHLQVTGVAKLGHSLKRTNADLSGLSVACHSPAGTSSESWGPGSSWEVMVKGRKGHQGLKGFFPSDLAPCDGQGFSNPPPPDLQKRISMTCVLFFSISMNWIF